jgi:hypothetical protein
MSMIRAAPTIGPFWAGKSLPAWSRLNSSTSITYGWPSIVIGTAYCGIDMPSHLNELIVLTCGFGLRCWISLRSMIWSPCWRAAM